VLARFDSTEVETMRILGKWGLTAGTLVLLANPTWAQRPGGSGDPAGLGGGPILLLVPNVQDELKLTAEQIRSLPPTLSLVVNKAREEMKVLRDLPPHEQIKKQRELTRAMNDEAKKSLSMSADQSKRFDQIGLQQRSIEAFADPEVDAKIMLTGEQKAKIREFSNDALARSQEIIEGAGNDREEAIRKIRQLQRDLMEKAQTVLTDDQKATWKDLTGEPFEVRFERRR